MLFITFITKKNPGMTESAYNLFIFWPSLQLLSPPGDLSNCIIKSGTYYEYYKIKLEMTESAYNLFFVWPPHKLSSLLNFLLDRIVKIIELPYIIEVGKHQFIIYHLYYKYMIIIHSYWTLLCVYGAGLMAKNRESLKDFIHLSHFV